MSTLLSSEALCSALNLADLTNPRQGTHAMQLLLQEIRQALTKQWRCRQLMIRSGSVVPITNNYDRLGYPPEGAARDARYTRYVADGYILRTQTSAAIPDLLDGLSLDPPDDLLLLLPGLVYRRDSIDRLHCGEPHQLDLWRLVDAAQGSEMSVSELQQMVSVVMAAAVPGLEWRTLASPHPYTEQGIQIDVRWRDEWIEVGECGLAARGILNQAGLTGHTGLAMGLGLDRLLMLRKRIPDIRLLRSEDPRVRTQMNDLDTYRPVSAMPAIRRDLSLCVDTWINEELIGDMVRERLPEAENIEALLIKAETAFEDLPASAHQRMGMKPGQKNILLQLTLRHLERTLTDEDANFIRNQVYRLLHQGERQELAQDGS